MLIVVGVGRGRREIEGLAGQGGSEPVRRIGVESFKTRVYAERTARLEAKEIAHV